MDGGKKYGQQAQQFNQAMNAIAYGETMMAAVRDYAKEMTQDQQQQQQEADVDVEALMDDPELQKLHADRIAQLQQEAEKRQQKQLKGHGQYLEITEGDFLEVTTKNPQVVCHFFHSEFERCKIIDKHLAALARKYFDTRFIKLSAPDAPFFTVKLNIQVLPYICCFKNGVAVDRVIGFEPLGGRDDFDTSVLEARLLACGAVSPPKPDQDEEEDEVDKPNGNIRKGLAYQKTASDEDSDFDD